MKIIRDLDIRQTDPSRHSRGFPHRRVIEQLI